MSGAVNQVMTAPGRQVHNVIEMSRLAPFVDAATANDPVNYANTFISYYTYGQALALESISRFASTFRASRLTIG